MKHFNPWIKCQTGEFSIKNEPLQKASVGINTNQKWDEHINFMNTTISAKIVILWFLRNIIHLKLLYNAIVQWHFDYADNVYDSTSEFNKIRLQRLQTTAAKRITALGVVAEWFNVLIAVPWLLMVWSTLALGTYLLRFVSWVFHIIFSFVHFISFDTLGGLRAFRKPFII